MYYRYPFECSEEPLDVLGTKEHSTINHPSPSRYSCFQGTSANTPLHVNIVNKTGYTPLHKAAQTGSLELVSLFVKKGADVTVCNHKDITPLHIACYFAHEEVGYRYIYM